MAVEAPEAVEFARDFVKHAAALGLTARRSPIGTFLPTVADAAPPIAPVGLQTCGRMWIDFRPNLLRHPAFADGAQYEELVQRFRTVPGLDVRNPATSNYFLASALFPLHARRAFFEAFDWTVARLRQTGAGGT
ncbi:MAG: hypothetical protein HY875_04050 [Chloroflexi bacterium]|nr:hypothetical protein [Chloroflexota bacterium]